MLKISKINPMVRSIGTMGAIAAVVGGVTFASLTSNTVALTNNTLSSSTANLQISNDNSTYANSVSGMTNTLTPGVTSAPFTFYVRNTGNIPLTVTAAIPTDLSASPIPAKDVTLDINCGNGDIVKTLADLHSPWTVPGSPLNGGNATWTCTATATLVSTSTDSGKTVTPFEIDFTGNQ